MAPLPDNAPIGLYLHIPFCAHICPYCDFNTYTGQEGLIPRYVDTLVLDIERQGEALGHRPVQSIFFGGGTPSLLESEQIGRILAQANASFAVAPDAEVTLEANPNSVDEAYFAGLRRAGVNRLSIGVQTLHRRGLRVLGRQHEAADAERALRAARAAGFDNLSLDLIFGWPGQTRDDWRRDLDTVLAWNDRPDHLSLYSLIVEPGTPMADAVDRGILQVLDDDATADLYEDAIAILDRAGWIHYEVANWTRTPGLESAHNRLYWRNGEYAAFGAGAHGRIGATRVMNHLLPLAYIQAIETGQPPHSNAEELSPEMRIGETMMLGLRLLHEGVTFDEFAARHGRDLRELFRPQLDELARLGLLAETERGVLLTHRGLMVANDVCARFLA
jgi:oxygen-independent coproporphyrinogen-3 oxidase